MVYTPAASEASAGVYWMAWKTMDVHQQRVRFVVAAFRREKPLGALCAEFGVSRPTGYRWLERYRAHGVEGIAEHSRRPHRSPAQTAVEREQQVVEMRLRYPDWGARKLQVLLDRDGIALTRSTIHRILLRYDLVRERDRHSPATQRFERGAANELWQMDFKGPSRWPQPVGPLSVLDDHSRYLIALAANGSTLAAPVQQQLLEAFERCGLPQAMLMDHGTPWWSPRARCPQSPSSGSTTIAGSTTTSVPTRRWLCRFPPAGGNPVRAATTRTRRAGSTRKAPGCSRSTARASWT